MAAHVAVFGGVAALGPVTRYLGRLETFLGRWAEAEEHLRQCLNLSATHGLHPSWADAAISLAEVLVATGRTEQATDLVAEAKSTAAELGLARVTARALALKAG